MTSTTILGLTVRGLGLRAQGLGFTVCSKRPGKQGLMNKTAPKPLYSTVELCIVQHITIQYSVVRCSIVQYSVV